MDLKTLENNHEQWLIDDFVEVANRLLPLYLPDIKGNNKVKEFLNSRLVRSYTTSGLIDEPIRQHRYAFYTYRHLLQLLLVKRLLSDGIGAAAIGDLLTSKTNEELKGLLIGGIQIHITTAHPSLTQISQDFGSNFKNPTNQNKSINATTTTNQDSNSNSALDFLADLKGKRSQSSSTLTGEIKRDNFKLSNQNKNTMSALNDNNDGDMSALNEDEDMSGFAQESSENINGFKSSSVFPMANQQESWTRLRILDGLELHIRDDFVYPNSIKERESLIQLLSNIFSKRC
ncbi:MerR family transcriptional regulator [Geminocystis sp.]|uniref:MerR family transcriptional regulator n=1 Tax=Geminocystis sp. TaxID=2664100 RepID=UPI003593EF33